MSREAGFDLCGITPAHDYPELAKFPTWLAEGRHGEMDYLESRDEAGHLKRESLSHAAPWARSVVVCALNYDSPLPYSTEFADRSKGWISRYAWFRNDERGTNTDYHDAILRRLRT